MTHSACEATRQSAEAPEPELSGVLACIRAAMSCDKTNWPAPLPARATPVALARLLSTCCCTVGPRVTKQNQAGVPEKAITISLDTVLSAY